MWIFYTTCIEGRRFHHCDVILNQDGSVEKCFLLQTQHINGVHSHNTKQLEFGCKVRRDRFWLYGNGNGSYLSLRLPLLEKLAHATRSSLASKLPQREAALLTQKSYIFYWPLSVFTYGCRV